MADTGIVYAIESGIIRRIIADTDVSECDAWCQPGEALFIANQNVFNDDGLPILEQCQDIIDRFRGKPSEISRCAVVDDTGTVVDVISADPSLDGVGRNVIIQDEAAGIGYTLKADQSFEAPPMATTPSSRPYHEIAAEVLASGAPIPNDVRQVLLAAGKRPA